ncbi:MAG: tRNA (adenosine(37)-N6)-threonylcarbamoyltransferase complex ATPase subunit type 1 TsaE [Salinivirgaceae bacterium]|jgi:tRNA threonylcarbamoyladenosine biosynthesis protein TsaE|nr:tRNA (adenosine(37)-N6)-threonylcarbamoyltransferase complex ATPase subunit type 1 TsaE [Salinivirgaceae bacterium]
MGKIVFSNLNGIKKAAKDFLDQNKGIKHVAFYGDMGAGKTTFIKELCILLKSTDVATSPTFSLINEYYTTGDYKIFHFDFYRIKDIEEAFNIGYEDYFYSDEYCFVEWPELVEELLPETMLKATIKVLEDDSREISF